ncbi:hypothetical protein NEOLEDRAFT_86653 [Neolentinus lepideus HHB14362 ss-1]|uniref:Uncharacterized protein n=1 Tax=Neolentinus lepideus HHB14362 ss-1 TaxID=1314782 RepID=A0A165MXN5_9AGAM|nr:hypothetical protein NEOLEDRAFT_86653 [Neolentinus lepideus HHB14362 ss-1]
MLSGRLTAHSLLPPIQWLKTRVQDSKRSAGRINQTYFETNGTLVDMAMTISCFEIAGRSLRPYLSYLAFSFYKHPARPTDLSDAHYHVMAVRKSIVSQQDPFLGYKRCVASHRDQGRSQTFLSQNKGRQNVGACSYCTCPVTSGVWPGRGKVFETPGQPDTRRDVICHVLVEGGGGVGCVVLPGRLLQKERTICTDVLEDSAVRDGERAKRKMRRRDAL